MKKISIVVALLLVAALAAVPASAQNFSDVEADHWAYEAVNELVATGIVEGYPDGTFGGDENMTRYEISMVLTRLMDRLEDERDELADDLEPEEGLTSEQALEVDAIVESMMEENMPEEEVSSEDVEEVTSAIEKLEEEYSLEMELISGFVQDNIEGISDVNDDVADLEEDQDNVYIDGEYNVSFKDVIYDDKDGTWDNGPIADPFAEADLYNDDDEWDSDLLFGGDVYFSDPEVDAGDYDNDVIENDEFVNTLDMDFNVNTDVLDADLNTSAALNYHNDEDDNAYLDFTGLSGVVEGNGFKATIEEEINPGLAPFLYNTDTNDGAVVEIGDTSYVLGVEDKSDEDESNHHVNVGVKHPVNIIGQSLNLYYGTHKHDAPESKTPVFDATVDSESNEVLGA
ncbi:MAG: S-layer homology domain-containing protein, partial [Halanaerobiaceae bacterium]